MWIGSLPKARVPILVSTHILISDKFKIGGTMIRDGKAYCDYCEKEIVGRCQAHLMRVEKHFCTREHRVLSTMNKVEYKNDYVVIYVDYKNEQYECLVDIDDYENKIKPLDTKIFMYKTKYCYFSLCTKEKPRKKIKLHRYLTNCPDELVVDHINRNPLDNRKRNLRCVNQIINFQNTTCANRSKSKVKGVDWHVKRQRWRVLVQVNKKRHFVGWFKDFEECCKATQEKRKKLLKKYYKEKNS